MNLFAAESSIGGAIVLHRSEPKKARIGWLFVYFLFFILLGYYIFFIYTRYKVEPEFSYKFSEFPHQEMPFPAVTVCSPLFARNQSVNLREFLKNPTQNLTAEQQNLLAANVQACAPELGPKIDKFCPLADTQTTIEALKSKFLRVDDSFEKVARLGGCGYNWFYTRCSKLFNYVLTDFGFCFTFNLEAFSTLFNTEVISDDFKCYSRDGKLSKNPVPDHPDHNFKINEASQSIDWNLESGFLTKSQETLPVRGFINKNLGFHIIINSSDLSNLCPKLGKNFLHLIHMPNEILTPFHEPKFFGQSSVLFIKAKVVKIDNNLRSFTPQKRNCYFEGERKLKFFKSYTKAHCQFECLANFTLAQCGCVKFSMPRESSTRICGLNETSCYIQVAKNWNLTCGCLQPCTYIKYEFEQEPKEQRIFKTNSKVFSISLVIYFRRLFGEKNNILGVYDIYQSFADLGGMLGTLFGASLISLIEIVYFVILRWVKQKVNIQNRNEGIQVSEFASSSTIHGVQFIFDKSRHRFVRIFWIFGFIFAFSCCIYNSRESYWKLSVVPEMELTTHLKPIQEIPFPAITICSTMLIKKNLTIDSFYTKFYKNKAIIKDLTEDQYNYLIANYYWQSPNMPRLFIWSRKLNEENAGADYLDKRSEVDLFPYLFRSHFKVNELFFDCKFQGKPFICSKLFKKVMTVMGICYTFNLQNYNEIFNEGISKNFDSYGKYEKQQESQWSLDQGYNSSTLSPYPARASQRDILEFSMTRKNGYFSNKLTNFYLKKPSDILTHFSIQNLIYANKQHLIKLSAKSRRMDENFRKFTPENRGCYFQDERKLHFFKTYTRSNCMFECFTNDTLKLCGCVAFLLPHNNSTRICSSSNEAKCYNENLKNFPPVIDNLNPCGCLRTCNDIEYDYDPVEKPFDKNVKKDPYLFQHLKFQFVDTAEILEDNIQVAFGPRDFLTNVGGFLGLYLGCSFISVLEVIYFVFSCLYKKLRRNDEKPTVENQEENNIPVEDLEDLTLNENSV